jgi:hypothetical protein
MSRKVFFSPSKPFQQPDKIDSQSNLANPSSRPDQLTPANIINLNSKKILSDDNDSQFSTEKIKTIHKSKNSAGSGAQLKSDKLISPYYDDIDISGKITEAAAISRVQQGKAQSPFRGKQDLDEKAAGMPSKLFKNPSVKLEKPKLGTIPAEIEDKITASMGINHQLYINKIKKLDKLRAIRLKTFEKTVLPHFKVREESLQTLIDRRIIEKLQIDDLQESQKREKKLKARQDLKNGITSQLVKPKNQLPISFKKEKSDSMQRFLLVEEMRKKLEPSPSKTPTVPKNDDSFTNNSVKFFACEQRTPIVFYNEIRF